MTINNSAWSFILVLIAIAGSLLVTPVNAALIETVVTDTATELKITWVWTENGNEFDQPDPPNNWATGIDVSLAEGDWTVSDKVIRHVTDPDTGESLAPSVGLSVTFADAEAGIFTDVATTAHGDHFDIWDLTVTLGAANTHLIELTGEHVSNVPLPAAAWLFGSGLLGLVGMARRKKSA